MRVKRTIDHLKKIGYISNEEYKLLNPNPSSEKFDTALLVVLLQHICNLNPRDKVWGQKDNAKIKGNTDEANIQRIRNLRNKMQYKNAARLEQHEFDSSWDILEKAMVHLGKSCGLHDVQNSIDIIKNRTLEMVTPEMKNLRENTMLFLKEYQGDEQYYIKTKFFHQAEKMLTDKHLTVVTGNLGEGKTTMAAYLALKISEPEKCLKLENACDWRKIDWSLKQFNTVIIDDIFGVGALNTTYLADWKMYLPEIERAAKMNQLNVIITYRHYIKEYDLHSDSIFKDREGNIVQLCSVDLTNEEKKNILISRVKRTNNEDLFLRNHVDIDECVMMYKGTMNRHIDTTVIGFPQCANLFVQRDTMIKLGARFFENPVAHYIKQMYNEKNFDLFLALVIVWAERTGGRIKAGNLEIASQTSGHIGFVANIFGIEVNRERLENISFCLKSHQKDSLIYVEHSGEYKFSHNAIGDMVGVVPGDQRHKIVETIELCPRDFLMNMIRLEDAGNEQFCVVVDKDNYHYLCRKVAKMILRNNCNSDGRGDFVSESTQLLSRKPQLHLEVLHNLDFELLHHTMFMDEHFVEVFIKVVKDERLQQDLFETPVMKLKMSFSNEDVICIPFYCLYFGKDVLLKGLIANGIEIT
ncbi:uncharacterized protein LOC127851796 [Dreissena polymorpha]|uniref:DZIP3-like HEPN domain-containing protein n=1 Tax=Dreissena polymorpha TaxID=45954 RepID=A0A9D4S4N5_DREPO|nr:uncharacterized protein LOC127851796 [Dreissena polymorpha]XP_052241642.1 uncharacterized protein LOC127851796 [Dreissena polymorpha]KAH3890460.1 hypothetical protein DPMN_014541 [Dreissena polymorpha]